jgi:hypothetical protein
MSNHRIILRDRAAGKIGSKDHEQRRNGNSFIIFVGIGNLSAFSNKHENLTVGGAPVNLCPGLLGTALRRSPTLDARHRHTWGGRK